MEKRGMKKYLPFSSLTEQSVFLDRMIYEKNKMEKPRISTEQAKKIDFILRNHLNEKLTIKFYLEGYCYFYEGKITYLDKNKKIIYIEDYEIPLKNIIDIESPDIFEEIC